MVFFSPLDIYSAIPIPWSNHQRNKKSFKFIFLVLFKWIPSLISIGYNYRNSARTKYYQEYDKNNILSRTRTQINLPGTWMNKRKVLPQWSFQSFEEKQIRHFMNKYTYVIANIGKWYEVIWNWWGKFNIWDRIGAKFW